MTDDNYTLTLEAFDSGEARNRLRQATQIILNLEKALQEAGESAADAESFYRSELAREFTALRDNGAAVEEAKIKAHGATAVAKRDTLAAAYAVKLAGERLEDARDSRRSLWRLIEWSAGKDVAAGRRQMSLEDERVPNPTWP